MEGRIRVTHRGNQPDPAEDREAPRKTERNGRFTTEDNRPEPPAQYSALQPGKEHRGAEGEHDHRKGHPKLHIWSHRDHGSAHRNFIRDF